MMQNLCIKRTPQQLTVCFCDLQSPELVLNRYLNFQSFCLNCVGLFGNVMDISRACLGPFHRRFCVSLGRAIVVSHNISNKTYVIQAKNIINDINFDLGQNTATGKVNFNQNSWKKPRNLLKKICFKRNLWNSSQIVSFEYSFTRYK